MLVISGTAVPESDLANRSWRLAELLSRVADIILAVPELTGLSHAGFAVVFYNRRNIGMIARDSDAVVCDPDVIKAHPFIINTGAPVAVDLGAASASLRQRELPGAAMESALMADFFFCSDENSRKIWLAALNQFGRINSHTRKSDGELRRLIDVVILPQAQAGMNQIRRASADPGLKPLKRFCSSPCFARDRGTVYNQAKMPAPEPRRGFLYYLSRLRYHLKANGARIAAARSGALIRRKISGN